MSLIKTLNWIKQHPFGKQMGRMAILRYLFYNVRIRISSQFIYPYLGDIRMYHKKGLSAMPGIYYVGVPDFEEVLFMLHFLQPDDIFIDVGANVGTYSIPASKLSKAIVHSFEPDPEMSLWLKKNVEINNVTEINIYSKAVGATQQKATLTLGLGELNRITDTNKGTEVEMIKLDDMFSSSNLLKIDVEGYEAYVLNGAKSLFIETDALIIEINGLCRRYGFQEEDVKKMIERYEFVSVSYDPYTRKLSALKSKIKKRNYIYVKDIVATQNKLRYSRTYSVFNQLI